MATDKPITGFGVLDEADIDQDDVLVIVDVNDTSQSSSGSTKQVTLASLFAFWITQSFTSLVVTGLATLGKIKGGGSAPSVAAGAQAGSGATVAVVGTDVAGQVTVTAGSGASSGAYVVVTFNAAYATTPYVTLTGVALNQVVWTSGISTAGFTVNIGASITSGLDALVQYQVIA